MSELTETQYHHISDVDKIILEKLDEIKGLLLERNEKETKKEHL